MDTSHVFVEMFLLSIMVPLDCVYERVPEVL